MRRILLLSLLLTALATTSSTAQDFTFSQFYEQPLLRNPALAGLFTGDLRVSMAYRDQWGSVTVPFRTTSLSIEHKMPVGNNHDVLTAGLQMSMDAAGDIRLKRTQLLPAINFHKSLNGERDTYLSIAFMGGPVSSQFDASQLKFGDQFVNGAYSGSNATSQSITNNSYSYWDLSTGLCFSTVFNNNTRFYAAAGISHITKPTIRSTTTTQADFLAPRMMFNMGVNVSAGDNGHLIAFTDYYSQNGNRQLLGGLMYGVDMNRFDNDEPGTSFYIGSFVRWNDALIPVVKMNFDRLGIGVSYDINISKLKTVSNWRGGLELTASYRGFLKIRNSTLDMVRCVKF